MTPSNSNVRRALGSGNPVIHGNKATFIWKGDSAPQFVSELSDWEVDRRSKPFKLTSDRRIWSITLSLPRDAYLEYFLYDPASQERFLDPLNKRAVSNGLGDRNNFFYMPDAKPSPFAIRRPDVRSGTVTRHRVDADYLQDNAQRDVYLYKPPVGGAVPLLIVYDGSDYLQRARLATTVDNLIAEKRIQPIAMAFLQNGRSRRTVEYFGSDATLTWLDRDVLPLARQHLRLLDLRDHPGAYGVLGASAGGLMAMYTGLRMPQIFGKVLCQSGVFSIDERDLVVMDLVRYGQGRNLQIWMDVGTLDDLLEDNRRMVALLDKRQYNVSYREFSAGHNYTAWRDDVWRGLEAIFPYNPR
jgi:enterochelin esterase family protein